MFAYCGRNARIIYLSNEWLRTQDAIVMYSGGKTADTANKILMAESTLHEPCRNFGLEFRSCPERVWLHCEEISSLEPMQYLDRVEDLLLTGVGESLDLTPLAKMRSLKLLSIDEEMVGKERIDELHRLLPDVVFWQ